MGTITSWAYRLCIVVAVWSSNSLAGAATPPSRSPEDLRRVYAVAVDLGTQAPECAALLFDAPAPAENLAAELTYEQVAAMLGTIVLHYPRTTGGESADWRAQREDKLAAAINAYRRAYSCHPGREGARHLVAAMSLLAAFEQVLRTQENLAPDAPEIVSLAERAAELRGELPVPPVCKAESPRDCPGAPSVQGSTMARREGPGEHLFFRAELGGGGGRLEHTRITWPDGVVMLTPLNRQVGGVAVRLSAGGRWFAGAKRRHVLSFGGFYSFQHIAGSDDTPAVTIFDFDSVHRFIHAGGLMFEWGVRFRDGAVSLHPGVEFGVQAFAVRRTFGQLRFGGALGLCFVGEILCITARGHLPVEAVPEHRYRGVQVLVGIDPFRIAERRRSKREP